MSISHSGEILDHLLEKLRIHYSITLEFWKKGFNTAYTPRD